MAQRRLIEHGHGPARVIGGFATGKTEALRARARRLANEVGRDRVLVVCRSSAAAHRFGAQATTFWSLALAVLARAGRPVRLLSGDEQRAIVGRLLAADGVEDAEYTAEVARTVCLYEASYLGEEELRTHATAAGVAEPWDQLMVFAARYQAALGAEGAVDWAGALVEAGLVLRALAVAAA